jgi:predicted anti-sigma-YlaC factor YlaD
MACEHWIAALSAEADGQDPGVDQRLLAAHLDACPSCRAFRRDVAGLRRATAVAEAPEMPDLSRRVATLNATADRSSRWGLLRALLAVVALEIVVVALPGLLFGDGDPGAEHSARHLGAFSVAYAVALLVVAVRPARARSILPVAMVLAGALVITAVIDVAEGRVPLANETAHIPEVLSVLLVWLLARPLGDRHAGRASGPGSAPSLRLLVPGDPDTERETG